MSDYYPLEKHDYLDDRTYTIVNGYIRDSQHSLSSKTLNLIPCEITHITLSFIDDHFMLYRGSYQFDVFKQDLKSLKNGASIAKSFEIGNLRWIIDIYANGNHRTDSGKFQVLLTCISIPIEWENIIVRRTLTCPHIISSSVSLITKYTKAKNAYYWSTDEMFAQEMNNNKTDKFTFIISIKILQIIKKISDKEQIWFRAPVNKYKKYYKLKWIISNEIIKQSDKWSTHKIMDSPIVNDIFSIGIGFRENGHQLSVFLALSSLPDKLNETSTIVDALYVQCTVNIPELNVQRCGVKTLNLKKWKFGFDEAIKDKLKTFNIDSLTILMDVEILNEYDTNGNVINDDTEKPWLQIVECPHKVSNNENYEIHSAENMEECKNKDIDIDIDKDDVKMDPEFNNLQSKLLQEIKQIKKDISMLRTCEALPNDSNEFIAWLKNQVKLFEYYKILKQHGYDNMDAIKTVNNNDLQQIGIHKKGHRQQLLINIKKLTHTNKQRNYSKYTQFDVMAIVLVLLIGILFGKWCL